MTTKFYAIDPQGIAHTRTSKSRTYTHTVVVLRGVEMQAAHLARAQRSTLAESVKTHETYIAWAKGFYGPHDRANEIGKPCGEYLQECGAKHMAQYASAEAYEAAQLARRLSLHDRNVKGGDYNTWINLGWCGRLDLARKLAAKPPYMDAPEAVKILEAKTGKPVWVNEEAA